MPTSSDPHLELVSEGRIDTGFSGVDATLQPLDLVANVIGQLSLLLRAASGILGGLKAALQIVLFPLMFFLSFATSAANAAASLVAGAKSAVASVLASLDFNTAKTTFKGTKASLPAALTAYFSPGNPQTVDDPEIHNNPAALDVTAIMLVWPQKNELEFMGGFNFASDPQTPATLTAETPAQSQSPLVPAGQPAALMYVTYSNVVQPGGADEKESDSAPVSTLEVPPGKILKVAVTAAAPQNQGYYVYVGRSKTSMRRAGLITGAATSLSVTALPANPAALYPGYTPPPPAPNMVSDVQVETTGQIGVTWRSTSAEEQLYVISIFRRVTDVVLGARPAGVATVTLQTNAFTLFFPFRAGVTYRVSFAYKTATTLTTRSIAASVSAAQGAHAFVITLPNDVPDPETTSVVIFVQRGDFPASAQQVLEVPGTAVNAAARTVVWQPSADWAEKTDYLPAAPETFALHATAKVSQAGEMHTYQLQEPLPVNAYLALVTSADAQTASADVTISSTPAYFATRSIEQVDAQFTAPDTLALTFAVNWASADQQVTVYLGARSPAGASVAETAIVNPSPGRITATLTASTGQFDAAVPYTVEFRAAQAGSTVDVFTVSVSRVPPFFASRIASEVNTTFTASSVQVAYEVAADWRGSGLAPVTVECAVFNEAGTAMGSVTTTLSPPIGASQTASLSLTAPLVFQSNARYGVSLLAKQGAATVDSVSVMKSYGVTAPPQTEMTPLNYGGFQGIFKLLQPVHGLLAGAGALLDGLTAAAEPAAGQSATRKTAMDEVLAQFDRQIEAVAAHLTAAEDYVRRIVTVRTSLKAALRIGPVYILKYSGPLSALGTATANSTAAGASSPLLAEIEPDAAITVDIYLAHGSARGLLSTLLGG